MSVSVGIVVLLVVLAAATAFGLWRRRTDGRLKRVAETSEGAASRLGPADGVELGPAATLVEFSTAFCQPCRATRRILAEVAEVVPGVHVVEIDAESRLELVRRLGVMRTPTVLVLDAEGVVRVRAAGQPRKQDVLAALATVITPA